jgi:hypothetical protein
MDNGVYRHLKFSKGSFDQSFDIVTYPWHLVYSGDMGTYVFNRLEDMFQFFRTKPNGDKDKLHINLSYWGEKLEAVDRAGIESGYRVFSPDKMKESIEEIIKMWVQECDVEFESSVTEEKAARNAFEKELRQSVEDDIYSYLDDGEHELRKAVNDFSFTPKYVRFVGDTRKYQFQDTWEWDCREYTNRFVWCCYAVAWAIQQYDKLKEVGVENEASIASVS